MSTTPAAIPKLYDGWLKELLGGDIPQEPLATCDSCVMVRPPGAHSARLEFFDSAVKCCTYVPDLHNFLVGQVLADRDAATQAGRHTVEQRLDAGIGVSPLGLLQPAVFALLYDHSTASFGNSRTLRCPHYLEDGRCGVWRYRDSTCITWFCKHIRGRVGFEFWRHGLHRLLELIEIELSRWCVLSLTPDDTMLKHIVDSPGWVGDDETASGRALDGCVDEEAYANLWGPWKGREREWYRRCADLVTPLSWDDVLRICGPGVPVRARLIAEAYQRLLADDSPSSLTAGPLQLIQIERGRARLSTYSSYDPVDAPLPLLEALSCFDGRPTLDAIETAEREYGVRLEPALVRKLVDFDLLVPAKSAPPASGLSITGKC